MLQSKHIDKICIAAAVLALAICVALFAWSQASGATGDSSDTSGSTSTSTSATHMDYEDLLFDTESVHTIDIQIDDWDTFLANATSEEYSSCDIVIDGETFSTVGIRGKGNTSLSKVKSYDSQRYSLKVEFDHYTDASMYHGLDKLSLNNIIQDKTYMKDYLSYQLMNANGVNAPLCSYAWITVNGEDWGLYLAVEGVEDSFMERCYGSAGNGDLYKPDSTDMGGGRGNGKDFDGDEVFTELFGSDADTENDAQDAQDAQDGSQSSSKNAQGDQKDSDSQGSQESQGTPSDNTGDMGDMPSDAQGDMDEIPGGAQGDTPDMSDDSTGDNAAVPNMPDGSTGDMPDMGDMPSGDMPSGDMPDMGDIDTSNMPDRGEAPDMNNNDENGTGGQGGMFGGGMGGDKGGGMGGDKGGGGMNSSEVCLQYSDDSVSSYSTIFNNAKTTPSSSAKTRLISSLKTIGDVTDQGGDVSEAVDIDQVLRYFVVHNYVCNGDSYTGQMVHNYYLYENEDGQLAMVPWDYNLAFGAFGNSDATSTVNDPIDTPLSVTGDGSRPMFEWILSSSEYTQLYHQYCQEFLQNVDITGLIEKTNTLIAPYVQKDPTAFYTYDQYTAAVAMLEDFCELRTQSVSGQLAGTIPSTDSGQQADSSTLIDASNITLSTMGDEGSGGGDKGGGGKGDMGDGGDKPDSAGDGTGSDKPDGASGNTGGNAPEKPDSAGADGETSGNAGDKGADSNAGAMGGGAGKDSSGSNTGNTNTQNGMSATKPNA